MWQGNRNYCSSNTLSLYYINIWRVYKVKVECHSMSGGAFRGWQFGFLQQMKCVTTHTLDGRWPPLLTRLSTFINKLSHIIRFLLLIYYASNIMRNMNALLCSTSIYDWAIQSLISQRYWAYNQYHLQSRKDILRFSIKLKTSHSKLPP